ncbi:LysE family translocator [Kineococcus sp. DHX-1]|uniref:LysE family translocator n=1 Tax=Kineococcus sp. DHX-1 TaxID=3349638 RepID=UPI0036D2D9B1
MEPHSLLAFAGLCVLLALAPGPDTFLVLRHGARDVRAGVAVAAGSAAGSLVWAVAVAVGLAALLEQSATAYRLVKIAGGLYLLHLGVSALVRSRRGSSPTSAAGTEDPGASGPGTARGGFLAGLLSCCLNPKVGLFFLAVAPQFLPGSASGGAGFAGQALQVLTLGVIDAAIAFVYLALVTAGAARAARWLRRPRVARALDRTCSAVLAAFGVGTLASAR